MKEVIIDKRTNGIECIALCQEEKLIEYYEEKEEEERKEGNIYLGKVQNILKGMQAAFVDIGEEKNTFIHLKDILPKKDVTKAREEIGEKQTITTSLTVGQSILVQVKRDATARKGARVSTHINLGNRFIALLPNSPFITASQKIEDEKERERLKKIVETYLPKEFGAIIRTSAIGKEESMIKQDIEQIVEVWKKIEEKSKQVKQVPSKLYGQKPLIERVLIDIVDQGIERIWTNDLTVERKIEKLLKAMDKQGKIVLKTREDVLELYNIKNQIEKRKERKIWLKCGGFITIDATEALVAIDVNSGKYTGKNNLEQTVLKVNKEASIEIAKQLRLRDIGGIIIIDYIDMEEEKDRREVIETLQEKLKEDRSKTQIVGFTKLNLLEMTRKHMFS